MTTEALVIDCDGHILEPPDLWETYLEPAYRDRALRIRVGDDGFEYLEIDGQRSTIARQGQLGTLGGMGKRVDEARELRESAMRGEVAPHEVRGIRPSSEQTYLRGAAFGTMDMKERVQLLDREGMAKAVLYPTLGLLREAELFDPGLSSAYCRAYNRWIADFCRDSRGRLVPIAHLSLGDPEEAARELERAVKDGCRGAFVCPFTITRVPHGDPRHDAVFAAAQDLDVPLAVHPTFEPLAFNVHHRFDKFGWAVWCFNLFAGQGVQQAFATFFQFGVFERFPRLRVVVLESQAAWIGYFLDRAVLHLGRPGRAHHRRLDAPRGGRQVLLGQRLPASRPSWRVPGRASRDGGADDRIRTSRHPRGKRRAGLPARVRSVDRRPRRPAFLES